MILSGVLLSGAGGGLVGALAGATLGNAIRRRRRRRLRASSRLECGLRLLDGELPGLTARWRHGQARVQDGELLWHQGPLGGQVRGRARGAQEVSIHGPLTDPRRVTWRERLLVAPSARVYRADQGGAVVEVAMLAPTAGWVTESLATAPSSAPSSR